MSGTIYDLVMSGRCTPKCLCATKDDERLCGCRCKGKYHAAATGLCLDGVKTSTASTSWYNEDDCNHGLHDVLDLPAFRVKYNSDLDVFGVVICISQSAVSATCTFHRIPVGFDDLVMGSSCRPMTNEFPCREGLMEILSALKQLGVITYGRFNDQPHMTDKFVCVIHGITTYGAMLALIGLIYDYITSDASTKIENILWRLDIALFDRSR
ncbi:hypothetical protein [Bifidobacterium pseudolongum]|uniref:hypothetical protein n=1 Tax=Bifidobacterium pseudolongum TaxID=1694 RepID=UPI00101FEC1C|nr:hypothetical protein [Bifidobacterium pseudolongum]